MNRALNMKVCGENKGIVRNNGYRIGSSFVELPHSLKDHQFVQVLSPELIESIMEDEDEFFESAFFGSTKCNFFIINADSLFCPTDLVMNFANATHPGGGYMQGSSAQEESLCRQSTLYASIGSKIAREMYDYNRTLNTAFDSDYMLLSPYVDVFRDVDMNFLEVPYTTAVMTIPAPNLNGRAKGADPDKVAEIMKERIRQYLYCAARYGYRSLTLGAWGCGAFGHDAEDVASYFHEVLVDEKMWQFFDQIVFAIYDKSEDGAKINAFKRIFADMMNTDEDEPDVPPYYIQSEEPFPVCNHTKKIGSENIGYCQGITSDGIPFEAELWENENERDLTIVMSQLDSYIVKTEPDNASKDVIGFHRESEYVDNSVLWLDMIYRGSEESLDTILFYINYLKETGLIEFTSDMENGSVEYCTDSAGNDLVHITVTLLQTEDLLATTALKFKPFHASDSRGKLTRIK